MISRFFLLKRRIAIVLRHGGAPRTPPHRSFTDTALQARAALSLVPPAQLQLYLWGTQAALKLYPPICRRTTARWNPAPRSLPARLGPVWPDAAALWQSHVAERLGLPTFMARVFVLL